MGRTGGAPAGSVERGAWDAVPYCFPSPRVALDGARDFAAPVFEPGAPLLRMAAALATRICSELEYRRG